MIVSLKQTDYKGYITAEKLVSEVEEFEDKRIRWMQMTDRGYLPPQVQVFVNLKNYPDATYDPREIFKVKFNARLMPKRETTLEVLGVKVIDFDWPRDVRTPAQAYGRISQWSLWQGMFRLLLASVNDDDVDLPCLRDGAMAEATERMLN